jgi:hypothetical protein
MECDVFFCGRIGSDALCDSILNAFVSARCSPIAAIYLQQNRCRDTFAARDLLETEFLDFGSNQIHQGRDLRVG